MVVAIIDVALISSAIWLAITVIVALMAYWNGLTHYDDQLDWSNGFDAGWESRKEVMENDSRRNLHDGSDYYDYGTNV